jgi:hypothetical protein
MQIKQKYKWMKGDVLIYMPLLQPSYRQLTTAIKTTFYSFYAFAVNDINLQPAIWHLKTSLYYQQSERLA